MPEIQQRIAPFLWFDTHAEEAAEQLRHFDAGASTSVCVYSTLS
jgi:predicted 3-demethylubiquinone-9 3-methyltransferase (glyoxalase superfamily)